MTRAKRPGPVRTFTTWRITYPDGIFEIVTTEYPPDGYWDPDTAPFVGFDRWESGQWVDVYNVEPMEILY